MSTPRRKTVLATNKPASSRSNSLSPLEQLKEKLANDAALLEELPSHEIFLVKNCLVSCGIDRYMTDGIKIGTIANGGDSWQLYALMSAKIRHASGLPEVAVFGTHPDPFSTAHERYPVETVLNKGQLRDEFHVLKGYDVNALAAVIKTCFILKGVELPINFSFTPRFIRAVAKICRRYRDGPGRLMSSPVPASEAGSSPPGPSHQMKPGMMSRKTAPRRPSYQLYDALGCHLSHSTTPPIEFDTIEVSTGLMPGATLTHNASDRHAGSVRHSETPHDRLKKKDTASIVQKPHKSHDTFVDNKSSVKHPNNTPQTYVATMDPRLSLGQSIPPAPSPAPLVAPWSTRIPTSSQPVPTGPASLRALDEVLELNAKTKELQEEVAEIQSNISKTSQRYHREKVEITQKIDGELVKRHAQELRDLQIRQKKEANDLKDQHIQLKKDEDREKAQLGQQMKDKFAELEVVKHDMDIKCEELSKEQLLEFFLAQHGGKKRKREDSLGDDQM